MSAFRETDNPRVPYLNLVEFGIEAGIDNAAMHLADNYSLWRHEHSRTSSTQPFVVLWRLGSASGKTPRAP